MSEKVMFHHIDDVNELLSVYKNGLNMSLTFLYARILVNIMEHSYS